MEHNPYQPPKSNLKLPHIPKGSPTKAVVIACCVDIFGSYVLSLVIGVAYAAILAAKGLSPEEIGRAFASISKTSALYIIGTFLGGSITIFSGYLCARIARCSEYKIITVYLVITVVVMTLVTLAAGPVGSTTEHLVMTILTILCGYFGAWLYIGKQPRTG